ncbi:hypothetical protein BC567DRAFT_227828 [Phyllosticta citribraziliensis]
MLAHSPLLPPLLHRKTDGLAVTHAGGGLCLPSCRRVCLVGPPGALLPQAEPHANAPDLHPDSAALGVLVTEADPGKDQVAALLHRPRRTSFCQSVTQPWRSSPLWGGVEVVLRQCCQGESLWFVCWARVFQPHPCLFSYDNLPIVGTAWPHPAV